MQGETKYVSLAVSNKFNQFTLLVRADLIGDNALLRCVHTMRYEYFDFLVVELYLLEMDVGTEP